ncbi:MAG TPA: hypothetical protein VNO55_05010, partial [Polyangia bacterium]|nr:hypothetical protein [Polyangia bacterium]
MDAGDKMNALTKTGENLVTKRCLTLSALACLGLMVVGAAGCGSQRRVACAPRADDFNVKITFVAGSKTGTGDCDQRFDGADSVQVMGMQPFFNAPGSSDRINSVAIQPFETGNYAANAAMLDPPVADKSAQHKPYAFGKFTSESPDSNDLCHVKMLSAAEIEYDMFMLPPPDNGDGGAPEPDAGATPDAGTDAGSDAGRDGGAAETMMLHAADAGDD